MLGLISIYCLHWI